MTSERGLRTLLAVIGAVATVAGSRGVVRGASEVLDPGAVTADVDSEYRFYASWYVAMGVVALRSLRASQLDPTVARAVSGGFLLAGCSRILSMRSVGTPSRGQRALTAIELAIPAVVLPWERRVRHRS